MNTSNVISLPVAADLSAYEHELVKLTSTGVDLCASITDRPIGTLLRGNAKKESGSAVGMACDVFLSAGNGLHFVKCGNATAITMGDELEQDATDGRVVKRVAGTVIGVAVDSVPASSDGGVFRAILFAGANNASLGTGVDVTQITSATTGVTASGLSGVITTVTQNIAAAGEVSFTVTNTRVGARDVPVVAIASGGTGGTPIATVTAVAAGSFQITITNLHASTAETGTLLINYVINKAAI